MQSSEFQAVCDLSPALTSIVKEFEGLVKQLWIYAQRNPDATLSSLEERARQLRSDCFASALEAAAQLHRAMIEEEWLLGHKQCDCGQTPQYKGKQRRTVQTWVGTVTLERGYFYCKGCGTGRYPLDEALGIPAREHFSDGVQQGVCLLGVQMPFEQAAHAVEVLTGMSVSPREAERMTEQRGLTLEEGAYIRGELARGEESLQEESLQEESLQEERRACKRRACKRRACKRRACKRRGELASRRSNARGKSHLSERFKGCRWSIGLGHMGGDAGRWQGALRRWVA